MTDIFETIKDWVSDNRKFALATVIRTWGSGPRPVGSAMAVSTESEMAGSVSGGCVEGSVVKAALEILEEGKPRLLKFGVTDEDAWAVGLSCGGAIHVYVEPFMAFGDQEQPVWTRLGDTISRNESCILITRLSSPEHGHLLVYPDGSSAGEHPEPFLIEAALTAYRERKNQILENEQGQFFIQVFARKSQMIIVGAAHITADLVRLADWYDFETVVIDPRGIFAEKTQFPVPPHQLINDWPAEVLPGLILDEYTYAVLLSHDPRIDDQALDILLRSKVAYIGALGSKRTQEKRVKRLENAGFSEAGIARVHGPVGVDINARRPKEIALSIMAEVIKVQHQFG
ncbi:MAG TPA: XdhC family protein [Flavilitoribacter sp.]|nr:XdhC family protein [Flavilitoribacter sp.]HMQ89306.1 XdhC family protein [Flavilitoribacter sp.]